MRNKKVCIISGNPVKDSFSGRLAKAYGEKLRKLGNRVEIIYLGDLKFDPVLRYGYKKDQVWEKDLMAAAEKLLAADHLVFVYPIWWGAMPALLKGFIDRVFLPGVTFKYKKGLGREEMLVGKTAEILVSMNAPVWYYRLVLGAPGEKIMKMAVLEFCGVRNIGVKYLGEMRKFKDESDWERLVERLIK